MRLLLAFPVLAVAMILQSAVLSRIMLLRGTADLLLLIVIAWALQKRVDNALYWAILAGLFVGIVSALPFGVAVVGYTFTCLFALLLRRRVWQAPVLAMFLATFVGTLFTQGLSLLVLRLAGNPLPIQEALNLVTLPSLVLNVLVAVPVFAAVSDLAGWLYPEPLEV